MNAKEAKTLDFRNLLEKMGYYPVKGGIKKNGNEVWYRSPLNSDDSTASFHLTKGSQIAWVFKCFSTGTEGTIIDFVIAHEGYGRNDVKSALAFLTEKFPGALFEHKKRGTRRTENHNNAFTFHQHDDQDEGKTLKSLAADRELEYIEDLPLKSGKLLSYLKDERKIPQSLSEKYLRLVRYKNLKNGKTFYAIGMKNRAGGFEIRAGSSEYSFKSALIARDITILKGSTDSNAVLIFEGFMDALSFLVYINREEPPCDLIVMHSVNSYSLCSEFINQQNYQSLHTMLDNDKTGEKCQARFEADYPGRVVSHSLKFAPEKDLNEALKAGMKVDFYPNRNNQHLDFYP